jgi:Heterokaryon incompatibility protein (HET)/Prion-inhibition and propagation
MRLLHANKNGELSLTEDIVKNTKPYAILSHTWGDDDEEVNFKDLTEGSMKTKAGYRKLRFCSEQAARDDLQYFWVDTCCIDKSNSTELSEAINSMFRWYRNAAKCYVYLSDVSTNNHNQIDPSFQSWELDFRKSRWFTRGWTLQELIAPSSIEFFSFEGKLLGNKKSLEKQIYEITGVAVQALQGCDISEFSVNERLSWAESRQTKREEDKAYCLLGLFEVHMPLIYGEGKESALRRLKEEIYKRSRGYPLDELPNPSPKMLNSHERQAASHTQSFTVPFHRDPDVVSCLDFLEQFDGYNDVKLKKHQAHFDAEKLRLKSWANDFGRSPLKENEKYEPRLQDQDLTVAVKTLLYSACELFEGAETTQSNRRTRSESGRRVVPDILQPTKDSQKASSSTSASGELTWAFKRKGQFIDRVQRFKDIVDTLYSLVPPSGKQDPHHGQHEMALSGPLYSSYDFC